MPPKASKRWVPVNRPAVASPAAGNPSNGMPPKVSKRWVPVNRPAVASPAAGNPSDGMPPKVVVPVNRPMGTGRSHGEGKPSNEIPSKLWVPVNRPAVVSPAAGNPSDGMAPKVVPVNRPMETGKSHGAGKPSDEIPSKRWVPVNRPAVASPVAGNLSDRVPSKVVPVNRPMGTGKSRGTGKPSNEIPWKVSKQWVPVNRPLTVETSRGSAEPADRLSKLPDALLHHIMSFLKAWEMVGTCRLSRRWRNLWTSAPCIDVRVGRHDNPPEEFAKFVHRLLRSRDVLTPVDTLRVRSVGEDDFYETYNNGNVKGWIRTAIKRKARAIQINGHLHKYFMLDHIDFASCHLKILKLSYVELDDKVVKQLTSQCPLEELELKSCLVGVHEILSFSLKSLTMDKCKLAMNLSVDAPNLMLFRCIKPEKWVPVFKSSVSLIRGSIMLDDSLLSREFQKYHEDEDEFPQTSDEDDDIDNTNDQYNSKSAAAAEGFLDSILFGSFSDYCDDYSDDFYDGYSDDIKDDYDYGSDINSDDGTYEYSEIANGSEDKYFGNCYDGFEFSKGGKISGYSKNHGFNDYETLGGQNILCSLSNARSIELLGHSGEVVLRRESVSCPTFNNLKTLSLGEWCISRGADFDILICLLQHTPYLENLFLQLEMNFDIQNALGRCNPKGGSFDCKHLRMVKIKCTKDDPRVHMLAQLFKANDIPLEKICVRRSGSFNLHMLKLNREINIAEMRACR